MASETETAPVASGSIDRRRLVNRVILGGWVSLGVSAIFLALSSPAESAGGEGFLWAIYLMLARLFGTAAFAIGGVAMFNRRYFHGIMLFLLAAAFPAIALLMHGTI